MGEHKCPIPLAHTLNYLHHVSSLESDYRIQSEKMAMLMMLIRERPVFYSACMYVAFPSYVDIADMFKYM